MATFIVSLLLQALGIHLLLGVIFAIPFAWRWVDNVDPAAGKGSWGFRAMIIPGVAVFWPIFLGRMLRGISHPPTERNAHRVVQERS